MNDSNSTWSFKLSTALSIVSLGISTFSVVSKFDSFWNEFILLIILFDSFTLSLLISLFGNTFSVSTSSANPLSLICLLAFTWLFRVCKYGQFGLLQLGS